MTSPDLPAGGVRVCSPLSASIIFVRYPASIKPPEGTLAGVTNASRRGGAIWREGRWCNAKGKPLTWQPDYWFVLEPKEDKC